MKLFYSPASPYSAKVRMAARHLGVVLEEVETITAQDPADLIAANPLGKIPVLVREDAPPVYDSVAIMHFLDRASGGGLYPRKDEKRLEADVLEALCDGITDSLLAIVYEKRFRPEEKIYQGWIDRQWQKAVRGLDHLEANPPKTGRKLHGGHFALAALIAYLDLRFEGQWRDGRPKLDAWPDAFQKKLAKAAG